MKDCANEFSVTEWLIEYFIIIVICYLLARLFSYILWKRYDGDDNVLKEKTDYWFEDYNSVMRCCKVFFILSLIPFANIFVAIILIAINIGILAFYIADRVVTLSWIPKKKTKDKLK